MGRTDSGAVGKFHLFLLPVFVAVARTNNIDAVLVFTLLLATWMLMKAVMTQRWTWLVGSFAVVGIGFNMRKMRR
ncbi:hypothetical protein B9L21_06440 [Geobacillus uzenensis]|uniref:Glycosyltransferase RgtA/B/C/D-like domain-containing protein n=1 Tax=Geobacillus uzenensis TaxID=129339 RepID=A0ABX4DIZ1_9BACL|nr:hypothetical protein B1694_13255 [Geobacillus zalihae]OXB90381.1 hypothetical protein B9L21_06440 [Geobacillus uzenensis]